MEIFIYTIRWGSSRGDNMIDVEFKKYIDEALREFKEYKKKNLKVLLHFMSF